MLWFLLIVILAVVTSISVTGLRRRLISDRVLGFLHHSLPPISRTEQEAIDAGTVWWDADLFQGAPDWTKLLQIRKPELSDDEQAYLDGPVEQLCCMLDDWQMTHVDKDLSAEVWSFLRANGFFALNIPKEYGGLGFSPLANSEVVLKICSRSGAAGVTVMVPNSLGPAELILHYGTEKQKTLYLPRLASGEDIPCFALTGPYAGSDASAIPDIGRVVKRIVGDAELLGFEIDFEKRYITLAPVATLIGLAFRAWDPDGLLGDQEDMGVTCALLSADSVGVEIGSRHIPMDSVFQNGPIFGKKVFVPLDGIIGGRPRIGDGWRMLMESLAAGRGISLPASAVSTAKLCLLTSSAYCQIRQQFNVPIARFEGVREGLARLAGLNYLMNATRLLVLTALLEGEKPAVISAMAKYQLTEKMREVVNIAMDLHGGRGICLGPANYLGRVYQQTPIAITVEGANILTRCLIIFGQGMMRCHPFLLSETRAALDFDGSEQQRRDFDVIFHRHILHVAANFGRSLWHGLTHGHAVFTPFSGGAHRQAQHFSRLSSAFALLADVAALTLGASLKRREALSGRFADAFCYLFMGSAALKSFHDNGSREQEQLLLRWSCQSMCYEIQSSLSGLLDNLPNRPLAWILRLIIFPLGRRFRMPDDGLSMRIVDQLEENPEFRLDQCRGVYFRNDIDDVVGCLEIALESGRQTETVRRRLKEQGEKIPLGEDQEAWLTNLLTSNIISDDEHKKMQNYFENVHRAISVDSFESV